MAYSAYAGAFNIDSSVTAGNDQSVTGVGFQPKIVFFFWAGGTAAVDEVAGGTYNLGFGAATASDSRWSVVTMSEDGQADSDCYRYQSVSCCIRTYSAAGTLDGYADFKEFGADGFTLTIDDQFASNYRVSFLALGGADLTNVYLGSKQRDADTGACAVTGVGFQPGAVIFCTGHGSATEHASTTGAFSLGWTDGTNDGVVGLVVEDNQAASDTKGYGYNAEVLAQVVYWSSSLSNRDSTTSLDADGFTLNQDEGATQLYYFFACLKGGQYAVGDLTTRTDGNNISEDPGFDPVALLFSSANRAHSTQDTATDHARISIGAATATDERTVAAISDEDAQATTETAYTNQDDAVYAHVVDDAIEALMDVTDMAVGTGFACVMDDTETSACWVNYLAIGAAAAGQNVPEKYYHYRHH